MSRIDERTKNSGKTAPPDAIRKINLALQGGGAHGAFTWGVCDRLLQDERIEFEGICGTSAGAMNAAALASGLAKGGRNGARAALANFWDQIAEAGKHGVIQPSWLDRWLGTYRLDYSPSYMWFDMMSRIFSPYEMNPMNHNPLAGVVADAIDFDAITQDCPVKLFLCATNVRTGKVKIFENKDACADTVLASACLPFMFQTVYYQGEPYWDGGYMGNPALFPLIYSCKSPDVMIIQINPMVRDEVPKTARDILERVNEISFNSSLMREMRAVNFVSGLIRSGRLPANEFKALNIHMIEGEEQLKALGASTKLNADRDFLQMLFNMGVRTADAWLEQNFDALNTRSTVDIAGYFL